MPLVLEKKIRPAIDDIAKHTLMIVGEKKIGKTAFCSQFPDHHILEFEIGNATHLDCSYTDIHSWDEAAEAVQFLSKNQNFCKTLIIDDIPTAYNLALEYSRGQLGKTGSDPNNYDVWRGTSYEFTIFCRELEKLQIGRIYTAHTETREVELRKGKKVAQLEPSWSKQCREICEKYTKLTGYIMWDEDHERIMHIKGDEFIKANNGFSTHFIYEGEQVSEINLGKTPQEGYANFMYAWNNFGGNGQPSIPKEKPSQEVSIL